VTKPSGPPPAPFLNSVAAVAVTYRKPTPDPNYKPATRTKPCPNTPFPTLPPCSEDTQQPIYYHHDTPFMRLALWWSSAHNQLPTSEQFRKPLKPRICPLTAPTVAHYPPPERLEGFFRTESGRDSADNSRTELALARPYRGAVPRIWPCTTKKALCHAIGVLARDIFPGRHARSERCASCDSHRSTGSGRGHRRKGLGPTMGRRPRLGSHRSCTRNWRTELDPILQMVPLAVEQLQLWV
jgi:hypothetical protein